MDAEFTYEYLIRKAWQVKRGDAHGADADLYRRMETNYRRYLIQKEAHAKGELGVSTKSLDDLEHEYRGQLRMIVMYVKSALAQVVQAFPHSFTPEQRQALNDCSEQLRKPTVEELEEVMEKASSILTDAGIKL